ncbi:DUF6773 family protein [Clostridium tagluense]|uniref:DUF6773 family protein n=1 Tax=Clostridium tagluense TaxID=360422 RepID=UPI001C0C7A1C|nr:DUF6773 family protein [Clostridium tagluense]MBU3127468.1 hypothetical protein [Clostridium tagluense]
MTNKKIKDERVVEQQRKIGSDAFRLVSMFLLASMLYKQFILNAPISTYITEVIAFFGSSFYVVLRNVMKGNDTYSIKKPVMKRYLLTSLISSSTITIVLVLNDYTKYMRNKAIIIIVFFCAFVYWFLISWGLNLLSKKRADKIAKQYEDE